MAIRKRVSLKEPIKVVSIYDDAIDWLATPRIDYAETRDTDLLVTLQGRKPTYWTLRNLPTVLLSTIMVDDSPVREQNLFVYSCIGCSDGTLLTWEGQGDEKRVRPSSLDGIPIDVIIELGSLAEQFARLSIGEKKAYRLPRGLRAIPTPLRVTTASGAGHSE